MHVEPDLQAAGRRAAMQAVPAPPPLTTLQESADKYRSKRRLMGSGVAAFALVALGLPFVFSMSGSTTVQNVVAGSTDSVPVGQAGPAQGNPDDGSPDDGVPEEGSPDLDGPSTDESVRVEVSVGGDSSITLRILTGADAPPAAVMAANASDETIDVDGLTVWVKSNADERTVAALVGPQEYVEVTGDADQLDTLIEMLRTGEYDFAGVGPFGRHWERFFGENGFEAENFNLFFDHDGEFGPEAFPGLEKLEEFFGSEFGSEFDDWDFDGDLEFDFDGDDFDFSFDHDDELPRFEQFFDGEGGFPGMMDDFEKFFGGEGGFSFDGFGDGFDGCISIDTEHNGEQLTFEYPDGCTEAS